MLNIYILFLEIFINLAKKPNVVFLPYIIHRSFCPNIFSSVFIHYHIRILGTEVTEKVL